MRRRRGQPVLGGRFTRPPNSYISQGPTNANEMNTFGETGSNQQSGYSQPTTDTSQVPPPPYHSKNSYQGSANGNIPQGGYPAPPGQPPAAHVNENV